MLEKGPRDLLHRFKPELKALDDPALNAEPAPELLDDPLTPSSVFFVRNNGLLPQIGTDEWSLTLDGAVSKPRSWSVEELGAGAFEVVSLTAVLECAGNGRSRFLPQTDGLQWGEGAVGCARWTGVRLSDLLRASGVRPEAVYVAHHSPDLQTNGSGKPAISRGLPIAKALAPETLVAFAMNGEPLPHLHGGPLRIVAPGYPGSAWQKWLARVEVREREHDGEKMTGTDYRLPIRPVLPGEPVDPANFAVITDMPVKSLITRPASGFAACVGEDLEVRGFGWSGHVPVSSVALSIDGGATWQGTELEPATEFFAWRRFRALVRFDRPGPAIVVMRATDENGRTQPVDEMPWNPRGYCNNVAQYLTGHVA